jgi:RNA polymerase sigma-B factor
VATVEATREVSAEAVRVSQLERRARNDEVRRLVYRHRRYGDVRAREQLVVQFLPLARKLAARYRRADEQIDDLYQVASLGLVKAIDGFDPDRGPTLFSYAVPTILGELKRYRRATAWVAHVPRGLQERVLEVEKAVERLQGEIGRSPSPAEVGASIGATAEEVVEAMGAAASRHRAAPIDSGSEEDEDVFAATVGVDDAEYERVDDVETIRPALRCLPERERMILQLRFVEDLTQSEIADRIGMSQMHVSRLIRRALERLRVISRAG